MTTIQSPARVEGRLMYNITVKFPKTEQTDAKLPSVKMTGINMNGAKKNKAKMNVPIINVTSMKGAKESWSQNDHAPKHWRQNKMHSCTGAIMYDLTYHL